MTFDMSRYLGLFVSEATENLEAFGQELAQLESLPKEERSATIDGMFRRAHSVKGMAASLGFDAITALAHGVEDLVEIFRSDAALLEQQSVNLLFSAADALSSQVKACAEQRPPEPAEALLKSIAEQAQRLRPKPAENRSNGGLLRYRISLRLSPKCQTPGVRAFLVHKKLSVLGNLFDLRPSLEDWKAGRLPGGNFSFELETTTQEAVVLQVLEHTPEIELVGIVVERPEAVPPLTPPVPVAKPVPEPVRTLGASDPARTVRVRTELLDYFLDTVGELLLATARIREVGKALPETLRPPLEEGVDRVHALAKDLHDKVMAVRMTPISLITDRLPRVARDVAQKRGRDVSLLVTGAEIELDRAILDELADPLLHLIRNCIDHGIESPSEREEKSKPLAGRVRLSVRRERDRVVLELEDDGRGMNAEKLKASAVARGLLTEEASRALNEAESFALCCLPGVSTAAGVSDVSGRGVGMDAVKRSVERVGGTLEIESWVGRGTRFTLRLPLTVAVLKTLLVQVGDEVVGLPISKVVGVVESDEGALSESQQKKLLPHEQNLLPVHDLAELLGFPGPIPHPDPKRVRPYLLVEGEDGRLALAVDRLLGQEEVVLKAVSRPLDLLPGLSGVTILGTGRPVFILDVSKLITA